MKMKVGVQSEHQDAEDGFKMPVIKTEPALSPVGDGSASPEIEKLSKGQRKRARLVKKKHDSVGRFDRRDQLDSL